MPLIGRAQVDYMVSKFQSAAAMAAQIRDGYEYFLVQRDRANIGYCALLENPAERAVFISKFYSTSRRTRLGNRPSMYGVH